MTEPGPKKKLTWAEELREKNPQKHPYRDTALTYLGFGVLIVIVATATGGALVRAVGAAVIFWVLATGWSFLQIWRRQRRGAQGEGR
jgi:hypothetical protein